MNDWWPIDETKDLIAFFNKYNRYVERCKGCGNEIVTIPTLKPICDSCTEKGVTCG